MATALPVDNKIVDQSSNIPKNVKAVTTRGGKSTRDPPNPNHTTGRQPVRQEEQPSLSTTQSNIEAEMTT